MTVGCGTHAFSVSDRDGGIVVGGSTGTLLEVEWNRVLDDASTARVTIGVTGPGCCDQLGNVRAWHQMLNLYRNDEFT